MKSSIGLGLIIACCYFISGCNGGNYMLGKRVNGSGNIVTVTREVGSFDEVSIANNSRVEIYKGISLKVEVEDYENIVQYTETEVDGSKLRIYTSDNNIRLINSKSRVIIHTPNALSKLHISGSGDIVLKDNFSNIESLKISGSGNIVSNQACIMNKVTASISGSGNIMMLGSAKDVTLHISGSGAIDFGEVQSKNANVSISGSGNIKVKASDNLETHVSGSGDIIYYGQPVIHKSGSGSGSIKQGGQ